MPYAPLHSGSGVAMAITPSDSTTYPDASVHGRPGPLRGFIPGTSGVVTVKGKDASGADANVAVTVVAGMQYSIATSQIRATGTTATDIVGLF